MERSTVEVRARSSEIDLADLRRPILNGLCLVLIAVSWLWTAIVATNEGLQPRAEMLAPPLLLLTAAGMALGSVRLPVPWRALGLLVGISLAITLELLWTGNIVWLYYESLVITMAALLAGPGSGFVLAAAFSVVAVHSLRLALAQLAATAPALGLIWATAIVSWLSSRNLYVVLFWAVDSQARAWRTANEVRRRREQLRRTIDSLRNAHAVLERTMRELEAAREEAEEARRVKSRFVANISHELRTPLNIIVGFAEVLCFSPETYGDFPWPAALRQDIMAIWRNAEHLLGMIDDVLDLAQIEASRMPVTREPTDLPQLIRDTLTSASGLFRGSGLELRVSLPSKMPVLNLDRTRIRQVLLNLINNATRYTHAGYIEVGGYLSETEAVVYVKDSGVGIPADKLESIFEEFEQVDSSPQRHRQGIGLGLAISRHFIRLHGGRMWAESRPEQVSGEHGSTFFFALPLPQHQAAIQPVEPRRYQPRQGRSQELPSLIVVSRDPLVPHMLERHLDSMQITATRTVAEAAALVHELHPEAVFVASEPGDDANGASDQASDLLRQVAPLDVPVLWSGFPTERAAAKALGVEEFLIKPVTRQELLAVIERLCHQPRRVMIVDDDPDMLALLARIVEHGYPQAQVIAASSATEATALLDPRPDIVLLDLMMPGMSGAEFLAKMRSRIETGSVPVAVISARGPAQELSACTGEVRISKNNGFTAGELIRVIELVSQSLPPNYVRREAAALG